MLTRLTLVEPASQETQEFFDTEIRGPLASEAWISDRQSMSGSYSLFTGCFLDFGTHCHHPLCHHCQVPRSYGLGTWNLITRIVSGSSGSVRTF